MFEKKRGKRFLASVMALVMLLSLAPVSALAAKDNSECTTEDTLEIQNVETYYELSGESNNDFTEARYIWEKDNTVYLAFTVSNGNGNGAGNSKPIQSATASEKSLNVDHTLYKHLKFGSKDSILAEGKNKQDTRWQIATCTGSIQNLLNTGNTLTISTYQNQGNGYNLDRVKYTVEDYTVPGGPGESGGTPGGSDGDGNQQGTADNVKVTYNANLDGADTDYTVPAEISVEKNKEATISKWTKNSAEVDDATVTATKDGKTYAFKGWSITQSGSSILHALDTLQVTENTTLYAIWEETEDTTPVAPPPSPSEQVEAMFFINLGGKDASKPDGSGSFTYPAIVIEKAINLNVFSAHATPGYGNKGYIFNENGVKTPYPSLLNKEPTDKQINEKINTNLPADKRNSMTVGDGTGREVVWYHVSYCGDGYHVDGYIKNVAIQITYNPNNGSFGAALQVDESGNYKVDGISGETYNIIQDTPTRNGYSFTGWKLDNKGTLYKSGDPIIPTGDVTLVAQWEKIYTVTFNAGENGKLDQNQDTVTKTGKSGTSLSAPTPKANEGFEFAGWVKGSDTTTVEIPATITENATYTATWEEEQTTEPENPTSEINAKYFVLMPNMTAPTDGSSRGVGNYFPNDSDCGGVEGKTASTGYPGKIKSSLLSDHSIADTQRGYANTTSGIDEKYLEVPAEMGYFSEKNYSNGEYTGYNKKKFPDVLKNLVGENQKFDMKNYQIVWYVVKKESNGYHVDGYVKGVPIQLNYYDGFNGQKIDTENLQSGGSVIIKSLSENVTHEGWKFVGWFTKDGTQYKEGISHTLIDSLNLYARWTTTYSVVTHFMGANGIEQENLSQTSNNLTGTHGKLLSELVVQPNITGNYVYVPSETKYSVGNGDKFPVGTTTFTEANTVIHQYYYLDKTGKTDEKGKDTNEPNNYPDAWEYKATFIVKNGQWDTNPTGGKDTIVKYLPTKDITTGKNIQATLSNVPTAGNTPDSHYKAGSWDPKPNEGEVITKDMTYTYTYSWRSSGGSGGSRPTVTIPDNVPTGLNGTDHYAYIIGYGNNDVRPQNNITRAEVATIFFRLLTDETREANMTKSNGYNDVKDGDWFCCAVSTLSKMGIIKGYEDGSFKPNDPISRAEFAAIAARFDPDGDKTPATFADVTSHWAKDEISIAANHGWIKGYEDGSFKPDQKITRAETMTLVNRVLNRLPETKDDLHKDMKTWVDNMDETAWYYLAVQEATNSHYFKNKTSTKFEQWTDLRDTRDWSELEK